jgi:hypothetical protein
MRLLLTFLLCFILPVVVIEASPTPIDWCPFSFCPKEEKKSPKKVGPGKRAKGDKGPYPRVAFCGDKEYKVEFKDQTKVSNKVCAAVLKKCKDTKNKTFKCPSHFYDVDKPQTTADGDIYQEKRCTISNPTMQKWFDAECNKKKKDGFQCLRQVLRKGDGTGGDLINHPCKAGRHPRQAD